MRDVWETGKVHTEFWLGGLRDRDYLEDLGILGMIILKRITKKQDGGMDWIDLAQERTQRGLM
jgi:hypothetical protein